MRQISVRMDHCGYQWCKPLNLYAQDLDGGELQTYNSISKSLKSGITGDGKKISP